jgi:hypothetical protein
MNAELEQWINAHAQPLYFYDDDNAEGYDGRAIMVSELEKLFDGKVLVPVALLDKVCSEINHGSDAVQWLKDWKEFREFVAASQEQGE